MAPKNNDLNDLTKVSASRLSDALRAGAVSPCDLLEAVLSRIGKLNPALNAIVHLDSDGAYKAARRSETRLRDGFSLGPLDGVPLTIKDNLLVSGMPATWGSPMFKGFVPAADEIPVARLRKAGAVILGKTNVPEFTLQGYTDNSVFGATGNPWNPQLTPGGSSGGAVAAVAAGLGPLAMGTDGGGSVRRPAGLTGLVGFKPSTGRIARGDGFPAILYDFEAIGLIARTVADVKLLYMALAGPDRRDWKSLYDFQEKRKSRDRAPQRILFVPRFGDHPVDSDIYTSVEAAATRMVDLGHAVEYGEPPFDLHAVNAWLNTVFCTGLAALLQDRNGLENLNESLLPLFEAGVKISGADYLHTLESIWQFRAQIAEVFDRFDLIMTPTSAAMPWPATVPYPAKIAGQKSTPRGHAIYTGFANVAGLPGISLPAERSAAGMPIGFQLVGKFNSDWDVLAIAQQYEAAFPWADLWPSLGCSEELTI